ncbi:MAG: bifunctional demethylmenaquinone methyltransferase/2-methoxy-6-polyprenyl-1,4-benzoquinol methylase UbiE [Proteobacteria bacterium]|nr:bifunctional demethylmenaquinone methyltransferase/2-methoxy-6-polyprenyl-1,4-benzoquinol methylase UbiE [Pseudomonadota bacterium]
MNRPEKSAGFTQKSFGFRKAEAGERTRLVGQVFASVAKRYDLMNDLMSLGVHRLWKADFVRRVDPQPGEKILDLAGGTGDIAMLLSRKMGTRDWGSGTGKKNSQSLVPNPQSPITVCDINPEMLEAGKDRAADRGFFGKIEWVEGNAEDLPFEDSQFDAVTIAFGLRNVTHIGQALAEARRVLKPGGRFFCLEFSRPALPILEKAYDSYSFSVLPFLGKKVAGDEAAYRYLAESIRAFPEQEKLAGLMREAGFNAVRWRNLSLGIAAVHWGYKA